MTAAQQRKRAQELVAIIHGHLDTINKSSIAIGVALAEIKREGYFRFLDGGFATFHQWLKASDLHLKLSAREYLTRIGEMANRLNIPLDNLEKVGAAKARKVLTLSIGEHTKDIRRLIRKAPSMSTKALIAEVDRVSGHATPRTRTINSLSESQNDTISRAIGIAKYLGKANSDASALAYVCQQYVDSVPKQKLKLVA
jgi:hypothetical protein